jgi:hypothetical protein
MGSRLHRTWTSFLVRFTIRAVITGVCESILTLNIKQFDDFWRWNSKGSHLLIASSTDTFPSGIRLLLQAVREDMLNAAGRHTVTGWGNFVLCRGHMIQTHLTLRPLLCKRLSPSLSLSCPEQEFTAAITGGTGIYAGVRGVYLSRGSNTTTVGTASISTVRKDIYFQ